MRVLIGLFMLFLVGCASAPTPTAPPTNTPTETPTETPTDTPTVTPANLPDLIVSHAQNSLEPRMCFLPSSRMIIYAVIFNQGTGESGAFDVNINGQIVSSESLPAGESVELHAEFAPNSSQVAVEIDPQNTVAESDESNNTFTGMVMTFTPPAPCTPTATPTSETANLPDLMVIHAQNSVEPRRCFSSLSRTKNIVFVRNQGTVDSPAFEVSLNGEVVSSIDPLPAGAEIELQAEYGSTTTEIVVEIDPENVIAESDEGNNNFTAPVLILTPPMACTPTPTP
jgi:hypothetical protein